MSVLLYLPLAGGLAYLLALLFQHRRFGKEYPPVVWSWIPFLGSAFEFGGDTLPFLRNAARTHGQCFVAIIAGERFVFVTDPHSFPNIFKDAKRLRFDEIGNEVVRAAAITMLELQFCQIITCSDDNYHLPATQVNKGFKLPMDVIDSCMKGSNGTELHKFFTQHLLGKESLMRLTASQFSKMSAHVDGWVPPDQSTEEWAQMPMFETLSKAMFAVTMDVFIAPEMGTTVMWELFNEFDQKFPLLAGGMPDMVVKDSLAALEKLSQGVAACSSYSENGGNSDLMRARWEFFRRMEGEGAMNLTTHSRAQVIMIWAMVANTMPAAFWTLFYLLENESVLESVMVELRDAAQALGNASSSSRPSRIQAEEAAALDTRLPILDACVSETLRLASGSLTVRRVVGEGVDLKIQSMEKTVRLRKGDRVCLYPPMTHYDPEVFSNPESFDHTRFLNSSSAAGPVSPQKNGVPLTGSWPMAFGGGGSAGEILDRVMDCC